MKMKSLGELKGKGERMEILDREKTKAIVCVYFVCSLIVRCRDKTIVHDDYYLRYER